MLKILKLLNIQRLCCCLFWWYCFSGDIVDCSVGIMDIIIGWNGRLDSTDDVDRRIKDVEL